MGLHHIARSAALALALASGPAAADQHGIAMYGEPELPPDFVSLPYADPDAPKGGRIVQGEVGTFDSVNPYILKGTVPWQLRYLTAESMMGRAYSEPFTLYGVLAESVRTDEARSFVEFTLHPDAAFSDGTPVTVEDVIWSYETLGTEGHPRYLSAWQQVEGIEATDDRTVRITFAEPNSELPLLMAMRPILKKAQWDGTEFGQSGLDVVPITSGPYVIDSVDPGRSMTLKRNPDYWGADIPFMRGQANLDEIRMEFFTDGTAMFEAFKAGALNTFRETNAQKWATQFNFPAVRSGDVVKDEIPHERPSGMTGLAMNTRGDAFSDWRVRDAMLMAFNYEFMNQTLNGGELPRSTSYFSNSLLGMDDGPAEGRVAEYLAPFEGDLLPGAMDGYTLPESDGTQRNRRNVAAAIDRMEEAGFTVENGQMTTPDGQPFSFEILLESGANEPQQVVDIFTQTLSRMGIEPKITTVDSAQFKERLDAFDFDMTWYQYGMSLSPGTEQRLYWGSAEADQPGSRNIAGVKSDAVDSLIEDLLTSDSRDDFVAATKALDRVLTTGRYMIPVWYNPVSYLAHAADLTYPETLPIYGDWVGFQPDVWYSTGE